MTLKPQESSARADRLTRFFRAVLNGNRAIRSTNDAKLFFEAVRAQPLPRSSAEALVASPHGLEALQVAVRVDLSPTFIQTQTLPFINYFVDDELKLLADGQILQQVLVAIAQPPTLWSVIVGIAVSSTLNEQGLRTTSWLCYELISLPRSADVNVLTDVVAVAQNRRFLDSSCPDTRRLGYKIDHILQLHNSPSRSSGHAYGPGGRHDNDFEDFRQISIYPTTDEFLSVERPFYLQAKEVFETDLSRRSATYLDNMFRLTREDFLGELRSDWQNAQALRRGQKTALTLGCLRPVSLDVGDETRRKKCSLAVSCSRGLERMLKIRPGKRRAWLNDNKNFLRHRAFGALYQGREIFGFAFIHRDIDALLLPTPVIILQFTDGTALEKSLVALKMSEGIMFTVVNTPVFAYEPILNRLKNMVELPLQAQLLDPAGIKDNVAPEIDLEPFLKLRAGGNDKATIAIQLPHRSSRKSFRLDQTQVQSLINALTCKTSVIQGPPGTGKSFIGALVTYFLLKHTERKILVITLKNHALDQFIEDLTDLGIQDETIVRLGSKSTSRTSSLLLSAQRSGFRRTPESWAVIERLKVNAEEQCSALKTAFEEYLYLKPSFTEIQEHLEFSEDGLKFFEAFLVPTEDDGWKRVGRAGGMVGQDYLFSEWSAGRGPGIFEQSALSDHKDVWCIEPFQRAKLVEKWRSAICQDKVQRVTELARQYDSTQERIDRHYNEGNVHTLREKRIIACTTTAAAMYSELITAAQIDTVIVEEAGEIQESHVLTALTPSVSQLIQIGDHKQLRPRTNNHALSVEKGEGYDLNRSLFERLVLQGHPHTTLKAQHRMHPEISALVRELTYPELEDDPTTISRPKIKGLDGRVIFMNHNQPETLNKGLMDRRDNGAKFTKENPFEAEMILKTVRYLAQQGYGTKNMVVLTPYLGQLRLITDLLKQDVDPLLSDLDSFDLIRAGLLTQAAATVDKSPLRISTIDNYQGEEADIVIASLTRSNNDGDIGFLSAKERLNVLLSRARNCIIMFGNMETFMHSKKGHDTWVPFFESMKLKSCLYDGLPVQCQNHPQTESLLKIPSDFDRCCPDGGCAEPCGATLNCGLHQCQMRCHMISDHSKTPCPHILEMTCERGHKMKIPCSERHKKCRECVIEDQETERRVKRDLKLEADRQARQAAYKKELEEIQNEIEHQRRIIKYQRDEGQQAQTLAQQRADLAAVKSAAEKILETPKHPPTTPLPGSFPDPIPTPSDSDESFFDVPDGPSQEWTHMKTFEGAQSELLDKLMGMIGLVTVKSAFLEIKMKVDTALRQGISPGKERYNCSMLGNPGTGKTTVARLYAQFLTSIGVIPGSCFKEETGAGLANSGLSGCKKLIEDVLNDGGGVIFIDEAYQLTSGHSHGGGAVLDYLLSAFENLTGQIVFVLAGYNKQMESLFAHNPGLPSRFPFTMKFEDYSNEELLHILELKIRTKWEGRMRCEDGPRGLYCRIAARRVGRSRGREGFGNARSIEVAVATIAQNQARRLGLERRAGNKPDDFLLTKEDLIGPEPKQALARSKAWLDLQKLTGLKSVKEAVKALLDSVEQNYQRELDEQPIIEYSLNRVFLGNPGTGKTTVAKLYARILVDLGMLSKGEVVLKNPSDFTGSALGESEKLTQGILAASVGKVLVIDEAYGLYDGQGSAANPYKTAVIDTIVAEVQSVPGDDRCVLLLGYQEQMEEMFFNVNPGLSRRFPMASAFEFEDFDDNQLLEILNMKLKQQGFDATDQAKRVAMGMLGRARNRPNFGNAGEIDILLNQAKACHQSRLSLKQTTAVSTFEAPDFDKDFDRAERSDTNVEKLFQGTVGNEDIVKLLQGYQQTVKAMRLYDLEPKESIPFSFLFKGPPGTGKTTTARKMGKVFYDMGFLATAEVVECSASDLIGQYVGQTGPKVQKQLNRGLGKVLFIDEAYRLGEGHFAKEAVDELVDAVTKEKYAKKLVIILAGYEADINRLMNTNSGLTSRFPEVVKFRSLRPKECTELLLKELKGQQARLHAKNRSLDVSVLEARDTQFHSRVIELFSELSQGKDWASARDVTEIGKAIFRRTIQDSEGLATGHLIIKMDVVEAELDRMLQERRSRQKDVTSSPFFGLSQPPPSFAPLRPEPLHPVSISTATSISQKPKTPEPENADEAERTPEPSQEMRVPSSNEVIRDSGVSDEVWKQLQRDRQAEQQRELEREQIVKAMKAEKRQAERDKILKRLLEEEERRKKEEAVRQKLMEMGACPVGYAWIRQASGYRCAGGSHYMSDADVEKM